MYGSEIKDKRVFQTALDLEIGVDNSIYFLGEVESPNQLLGNVSLNEHKSADGSGDMFVSKIDSGGKPIWNLFVGGSYHEGSRSLSVYENQIVIVGFTYSADFPEFINGINQTVNNQTELSSPLTFYAQISDAGDFMRSRVLRGIAGRDVVAIDSGFYMTGNALSSAFGNSDKVSDSENNVFVAKYIDGILVDWEIHSQNYPNSGWKMAINSEETIIVVGSISRGTQDIFIQRFRL